MLKLADLRLPGLAPISFTLDRRECLVVRGASGSGKTLLLRAIADLDPVSGQISLEGQRQQDLNAPVWRRRVRYLQAEPAWWADTPAAHFEALDKPEEMAAQLGLKPGLMHQPISRLSTGERQRLALMRALQDDPPLLLLDEPTAALDAIATAQVEALLLDLLARGRIIIMVSHDEAQGQRMATHFLRIAEGRAAMAPASIRPERAE